jgi:hypothetical protein
LRSAADLAIKALPLNTNEGEKGHMKRANRALKLSLLYFDNPVQAINKHQTGCEE